jgi:hypothetical protein
MEFFCTSETGRRLQRVRQKVAENQDKDVTFIYEFHTNGQLLQRIPSNENFSFRGITSIPHPADRCPR